MAEPLIVTVEDTSLVTATTALANPVVIESMASIADVDTTNLTNGSVLVYKTATNKWTSTLNLEDQYMNGGFF
jgi:hypothetical protein